MSISGIEGLGGLSGIGAGGFQPYVAPTVPTTTAAPTAAPTGTPGIQSIGGSGPDFGSMVIDGIERLEGIQDKADGLAVQAATGTLDNIHDYTMAATEAQVTTQLTVAVRNKAVEAFNEIMRMPIG